MLTLIFIIQKCLRSEFIYSIIKIGKEKKKEQKNELNVMKEIILMLSEMAGMGLIVIQILQATKVI